MIFLLQLAVIAYSFHLPRGFEQALVESDLRSFVNGAIDRALHRLMAHLQSQRRTELDVCLDAPAGRVLRHRCCVFTSNLAMALLHFRYAEGETVAAIDALDGATLDGLMRYFAIVGPSRPGVYALPLVLARGVAGTLVKCEFGDVHTYLVFRADDARIDDVIVDVSYRQFLLVLEHVDSTRLLRSDAFDFATAYPSTFVGVESDLVHRVFNRTAMARRMRRLGALKEPEFSETVPFLAQLFSKAMRDGVCGRAMQHQQQQQE